MVRFLFILLKGLSHEMDLTFDDMYGHLYYSCLMRGREVAIINVSADS
jgi:hypothetical protein